MGISEWLKNFFGGSKVEDEFVTFSKSIAKLKGKQLSDENLEWIRKEINIFSAIFANRGHLTVNRKLQSFLVKAIENRKITREGKDLLREALAILQGKEEEKKKEKRKRLQEAKS